MKRQKPHRIVLPLFAYLTLFCVLGAQAQTPAERRDEMKEWVHIQKILSSERTEWKVEKAVVEDMLRVLAQEKADLEERIEVGQSVVSTADRKRSELETARDELRAATGALEKALPAIEASVKALVDRFPEPLQQVVSPLYNRLPELGASTRLSLSERLQTVVGILSQADKFNSVITDTSENRTIASGSVIVQTLYFGLGGAIYADPGGETAGVLLPTASGWESKEMPEHAEAIVAALEVYASLSEAAFVELPVSLK